jgi:hypothetical protein
MNRAEIMDWVRLYYGGAARGIGAELAGQLEVLASSSEGGPFLVDYFEAALNSRDLLERVKLVHFTRPAEQVGGRGLRERARKRKEDLEGLLKSRRGFDLKAFGRMYDAVFAAGHEDFYPVASVEWDVRAGRFEEVSLYCDQGAPALAAALGRALGVPEAELEATLGLSRLFAVGYDFRPGKPSRFKLYHRSESARACASGKPFLALPKAYLPADFLVLRRKPGGGPFEDVRKAYLCYVSPGERTIDCRVSVLAKACAPGPFKKFLDSLLPAAEYQYLDYVGCEGGVFEAYFGKPAWGRYVEQYGVRHDGEWVLP